MTPFSDLSPLEMERSGDHLRFTLKPQADILPELPADFEAILTAQLDDILRASERLTAEIDLADSAAISSRELGSLIALMKVLRLHFDRVPVHGVSDGVRHLLELTRTDRLFDVE